MTSASDSPEDADLDELAGVDDVLLLDEAEGEHMLAVWEPTGEPRVDAALDRLAELDDADIHQHAGVFQQVHQELRDTLTDLDASA